MALILIFLISSGSKKKEPRCVCLSEAKASHSHKMWTEVSSSVPHFLQAGLLLSPIIYRCLLRVLCPVRRPIATLDCVLSKDNDRALVTRSGPEITSRACLCVLQGLCHNTRCWFSIQHFIFFHIFGLETPQERLRSNKPLNRTVSWELVGDFTSSHSGMPMDPIKSNSVPPVPYPSTIAPPSSSSTRYCYQKDKRAKPGNLLKNKSLSEIWKSWIEKCFRSIFCL